MAGEYNIKWSHDQNGGNPLKPRFTINTNAVNGPGNSSVDTPLLLPGRFSSNYGQNLAQSFIWMLENFSSPNEPSPTTSGMLWFDSANEVVNVRNTNNNGWVELGAGGSSLVISPTEPTEYDTGTLWFDTSVEVVKIRNTANNDWISINASGGGVPTTTTEASAALMLTNAHTSKYVRLLNAAAVTVTVPADATDDMAIDTEIHLRTTTDGTATIVAESGVTINCPYGFQPVMDVAGATVTLKKVAADEWDLFGLLAFLTIFPAAVFSFVAEQTVDGTNEQTGNFTFLTDNLMVVQIEGYSSNYIHIQAYDTSVKPYVAVGNMYTAPVTNGRSPSNIFRLTDNRVVSIRGKDALALTLEFDGTDWAPVGNDSDLQISPAYNVTNSTFKYTGCRLSDTEFVLFLQESQYTTDDHVLMTYSFDGTVWNLINTTVLPTYSAHETGNSTYMDDGRIAISMGTDLSMWEYVDSTTGWQQVGNTLLGTNIFSASEYWNAIGNTKKGDDTIYMISYDWPDSVALVRMREFKFDGTDWTITTDPDNVFELTQYLSATMPIYDVIHWSIDAPEAGRAILRVDNDDESRGYLIDVSTVE